MQFVRQKSMKTYWNDKNTELEFNDTILINSLRVSLFTVVDEYYLVVKNNISEVVGNNVELC